jgi:hypothetical protein
MSPNILWALSLIFGAIGLLMVALMILVKMQDTKEIKIHWDEE